METFTKLFGSLLVFVYHCFDRIVINGYLEHLSRPELVVHFFREVLGVRAITKEALGKRTVEYKTWVEAYAKKQKIPMQWAEKGVRKEDFVRPFLKKMEKQNRFGVYFIFLSMEQGTTFRSAAPKYPTADPDYRILSTQRSRFTHYYFYIRDEILGPMVIRVATFLPFQTTYYLNGHSFMEGELKRNKITYRKDDNAFTSVADPAALQAAADRLTPEVIRKSLDYWTLIVGPKFSKSEQKAMNLRRAHYIHQVEYCRNFIFKRNFPIHKIFERSCDLALWRMTAHKISEMFGVRLSRQHQGKLHTVMEQFEHGHHVFRAYWKNSFLKQYEKLATFLRNELCCNDLKNFRLKKALDNLPAVRERFIEVTDRFAGFQAECLNVHVDFPLLQRIALPISHGSVKVPGIKIHDTRMIRLMEVLLHAGTQVSGWSTRQIHDAVLSSFQLTAKQYGLAQLRYDLRKLKAHGLLQRDGRRYAYRLSDKGASVALLFLFFHKQLCGPLANSRFHHKPAEKHKPDSPIESAYYKADAAIQQVIDLLAAA